VTDPDAPRRADLVRVDLELDLDPPLSGLSVSFQCAAPLQTPVRITSPAFAPAPGASAIPLATSSATTNDRWIVPMTSPLSVFVLRMKRYSDEVH
jgi:hypothetical protein